MHIQNVLMVKQFTVRYGRNYKIVLAIVLPCLLIVPFILWMQNQKSNEEWIIWLNIFAFLIAVIFLSLWLVLQTYPRALFSINKNEISLSFERSNFLNPSNFSFNVIDIKSFTLGKIGGDEYYVFETRNPSRKFQISASSRQLEDLLSFNEAMVEISEMVNKAAQKVN